MSGAGGAYGEMGGLDLFALSRSWHVSAAECHYARIASVGVDPTRKRRQEFKVTLNITSVHR